MSLSVGRAMTYLWIDPIWTPLSMDTSMNAFSYELWMIVSSEYPLTSESQMWRMKPGRNDHLWFAL